MRRSSRWTTRIIGLGGVLALMLALSSGMGQDKAFAHGDPPPTTLFYTGGTVTVTVLPASAGYTSELRLYSAAVPASPFTFIALNSSTGAVVPFDPSTLGFAVGQELVFGIYVRNTGDTFFIGPGSRNADGHGHAMVTDLSSGNFEVGFEDLFGGGDHDFDDNRFHFAGGVAAGPVNNNAPDCTTATASTTQIWPPNHQFVPITVLGITDIDGDVTASIITSIWQDELVNAIADGSTGPDGQGVGTDTAEVRAERSGSKKNPGDGRVYHIGFTANDGNGGSCSGSVTVGVPHDQGGQRIPVDGGALYDSTIG